jgi:hypothetical protein
MARRRPRGLLVIRQSLDRTRAKSIDWSQGREKYYLAILNTILLENGLLFVLIAVIGVRTASLFGALPFPRHRLKATCSCSDFSSFALEIKASVVSLPLLETIDDYFCCQSIACLARA